MWWMYFYGTRFLYPKAFLPGHKAVAKMRVDNASNTLRQYGEYVGGTHVWSLSEFVRSLLMVSIHIAACYIVVFFLLPRFLLKSKYFQFTGLLFLLAGIMVVTSRFMDTVIIPAMSLGGNRQSIPFYSSIFSGVINAIIIIAAASIIKFGKYWWQKQKEKEQMEKEKINTELQLLKAQVRPGFLFHSLNNIYNFSMAASPRAPELLLKLSTLLSYMLYECDDQLVPLDKEIEMMRNYISMEKIRLEGKTEIEFSVSGNLDGKMIAPFILLPFIENSLRESDHSAGGHWINLDISMDGNELYMKLANGISEETSAQQLSSVSLLNVQKRLLLLYPARHELKMSYEPEMLVVILKIRMEDIPGVAITRDDEVAVLLHPSSTLLHD
jgi:hypothetical protein